MSEKTVSALKQNDTAYMFGGGGGRRGATGAPDGTQVTVTKVGRAYIYVARTGMKSGSGWLGEEIKFDRNTGIEADVDNYRRLLVVDRDAYVTEQKAQSAYCRLRESIPRKKPDGVTRADVEAAAKLLGVDLGS